MDDSAQKSQPGQAVSVSDSTQAVTAQTDNGVNSVSPAADIVSAPVSPKTPPVAPSQPVSGPHKEHAPIATTPKPEAYVTPTEIAPELPIELKEAGIEASVTHDKPVLTEEHAAIGIEHAKDAVAVQTTPSGKITFPITKEEVKQMHKQYSWKDSFRWFFELVLKEEQEKQIKE